MHSLYDTYKEYGCYRMHWYKFRQQLQLYDKISSTRFHYRQQQKKQKTSLFCIHVRQLWCKSLQRRLYGKTILCELAPSWCAFWSCAPNTHSVYW